MSINKEFLSQIKQLEMQEETLQFDHFSNADALQLGLLLVEHAKEKNYPIAIDITKNGHQVFKYAFDGANIHNDMWIARKINAVNTEQKSSMHLGVILKSEGLTSESECRFDPKDYAFHGGCFPINVKGTGVIGTITVSGMPQEVDHQIVVDILRSYLKK